MKGKEKDQDAPVVTEPKVETHTGPDTPCQDPEKEQLKGMVVGLNAKVAELKTLNEVQERSWHDFHLMWTWGLYGYALGAIIMLLAIIVFDDR